MNIVGVQFRNAGRIYDFIYDALELQRKDPVIVDTEEGLSFGTVAILSKRTGEPHQKLKPVLRKADEKDFRMQEKNIKKAKLARDFCKRKIHDSGLPMKFVEVEYLHAGTKAIFYFTAEERVDFRALVKDLVKRFHVRVELRQIGVRDEAKIAGGIGICGRELCCATWLREFEPISVTMAKTQNLSASPSKLAGQCGRLRCCLRYENQTYAELRKALPSSCGSCAKTSQGVGTVVNLDILNQKFSVRLDDSEKIIELGPEDFLEELRPAQPLRVQPHHEEESIPEDEDIPDDDHSQ